MLIEVIWKGLRGMRTRCLRILNNVVYVAIINNICISFATKYLKHGDITDKQTAKHG